MVEVVNMKCCYPHFGTLPGDVRIDRKTKWGNPFILNRSVTRDMVCDAYALYLLGLIQDGKRDIRELIHAKRLGCWCKPERCHGDFIKTLIDDEIKKIERDA